MSFIEITFCPYCEKRIVKDWDYDDRLFGSRQTCPRCGENFVVSSAHVQKREQQGNCTYIIPVCQKKTYTEEEEGLGKRGLEQSTLEVS